MKHTLGAILFLAGSYVSVFAQEEGKERKMSPEEQAWMAYSKPGNEHALMAKSAGMWNEEITMWMSPDAPPEKSNSTCINRMIMGGRYLEGRTRGSFNGMPFEGISITAFDNARKIYQGTWIDNMGTGIMLTEGPYQEETKSIEMKGSTVDPMTGKEMAVRETLKFIDDNTQYMEMYLTKDGKEFKTMEIKLTRKTDTVPPAKK